MSLGQGIHDIHVDEYFADPAPEVSLSASGARRLLDQTPAHFKAHNLRITDWPDLIERRTTATDLGSIVHSILLGKGAQFAVIKLSDYTNKDGSPAQTFNNAQAKRAKETLEAQGQIVVTGDVYANACDVASAAEKALIARFGQWPMGESEMTMLWKRAVQDPKGFVWCRALVDHLALERGMIFDLKTTSKGLSDEELSRGLANNGSDLQAAHYLSGLETTMPQLAGRAHFEFVFVEVDPPFETRFIEASEGWLTRARFRLDRAAETLARCIRTNDWPGYPRTVTTLSAPSYLEARWESEELSEVEGAGV